MENHVLDAGRFESTHGNVFERTDGSALNVHTGEYLPLFSCLSLSSHVSLSSHTSLFFSVSFHLSCLSLLSQ